MQMKQELKRVQEIYEQNQALEAQIKLIEAEIAENHQRIISEFFPYLLSVYAQWRPFRGEKAVHINFDMHICFTVTVVEVNGYRVRAQEGEKSVYHNFMLNPKVEEYEIANFIIPQWSYDEIKDLFDMAYWGP